MKAIPIYASFNTLSTNLRAIIKFGGTAVVSADRIKHITDIIKENKDKEIVIVVSAIRGITDKLINVCKDIEKGKREDLEEFIKDISAQHIDIINNAINNHDIRRDTKKRIEELLSDMSTMLHSMNVLGEVTPRSMDYIVSFGERLIAPIVASALNDAGIKSEAFTGKDAGILTDSTFGEAIPLMDTTRLRVKKNLEPLLKEGIIPVVTGFVAADQYGHITTLGRGGSDYTATILADALDADEVWLMTDVDGLMTADPKIVSNAKVIREVSYAEAMELALFGAKYMHPRALEPVQEKSIPVRIRNVFKPKDLGTLIVKEPSSDSKQIVKSVSMIKDLALIDVRGSSMAGAPGTAGKIFNVLGEARVNIIMISQGPSESSISMVVRKNDLDKAVTSLELNLLGRLIKNVNVTDDVAVIAAVGSGMRGIKGVASRIFQAVANQGINVIMIAQGSSELDLAFVVDAKDSKDAVRAIHDEFRLGN
ncbi:MAG: aspartate kinase [Candidatus Nitrosocaldaceae archaeon]|nr:MAG: aspartate kinase [Candidatus Nitrosocaldaceae archaeon]